MSSQELERIKLDIHNNLSYEETDLLQDYIESIQTPEWTKRRKQDEENERESEFERNQMLRDDAQEEKIEIEDDDRMNYITE